MSTMANIGISKVNIAIPKNKAKIVISVEPGIPNKRIVFIVVLFI
jgi:hypothetical protein